jgi:hypothetical protein
MNRGLEEDLQRWAAGLTTLPEIEQRHPGEDVHSLTELHRQLTALGQEPTSDPEAGWRLLSSRLPGRTPDLVLIERHERRRRHTLTRSRVALLGLAAALVLTGGLASAGVLPNPVQGAVAGVVGHLGFHFPRSADLPDKASHGEDVSNIARSARGEHCRSGKAVAHVASSLAKGRRRNDPPALDTCAGSRPGRSPTAGSTSLTKGHSRQGQVGGPTSGVDRSALRGP